MSMSATASLQPQAPVRVRVAGPVRRLAASVLDGAIVGGAFLVLFTGVSLVLGERLPMIGQLGPDHLVDAIVSGQTGTTIALVILGVVSFLYTFLFLAVRGQTPGKRVLGIRVIDGFGDRPSMPRALVRTLAYIPAIGLLGLGLVWIAFDRERRGLHDWIADTYVVLDREQGAPRRASTPEAAQ